MCTNNNQIYVIIYSEYAYKTFSIQTCNKYNIVSEYFYQNSGDTKKGGNPPPRKKKNFEQV